MANHRYGLSFNELTDTYVAFVQMGTMKRDAAITYLANKLDKSVAKVSSVLNSFGKAIAGRSLRNIRTATGSTKRARSS